MLRCRGHPTVVPRWLVEEFRLQRRVKHFDDKVIQLLVTEQPQEVEVIDTLEADRAQGGQPEQELREPSILRRMLRFTVLVQTGVDFLPHLIDLLPTLEPSDVGVE